MNSNRGRRLPETVELPAAVLQGGAGTYTFVPAEGRNLIYNQETGEVEEVDIATGLGEEIELVTINSDQYYTVSSSSNRGITKSSGAHLTGSIVQAQATSLTASSVAQHQQQQRPKAAPALLRNSRRAHENPGSSTSAAHLPPASATFLKQSPKSTNQQQPTHQQPAVYEDYHQHQHPGNITVYTDSPDDPQGYTIQADDGQEGQFVILAPSGDDDNGPYEVVQDEELQSRVREMLVSGSGVKQEAMYDENPTYVICEDGQQVEYLEGFPSVVDGDGNVVYQLDDSGNVYTLNDIELVEAPQYPSRRRSRPLSSGNMKRKGQTELKCMEKDCIAVTYNVGEFRKHLHAYHGYNFEEETVTFHTEADFKLWREGYERERMVSFIYRGGTKKIAKDQAVTYLICHRSGHYKPTMGDVSQRKRKMKPQGSCKMGGYCTAGIKLLKNLDTGNVRMDICHTHYGHSVDNDAIPHLRVSPMLRKVILTKFQEGMTFNQVLEYIHHNPDQLEGLRLVDRRAVRNIFDQWKNPRLRSKSKPAAAGCESSTSDPLQAAVDSIFPPDESDKPSFVPKDEQISDTEEDEASEPQSQNVMTITTNIPIILDDDSAEEESAVGTAKVKQEQKEELSDTEGEVPLPVLTREDLSETASPTDDVPVKRKPGRPKKSNTFEPKIPTLVSMENVDKTVNESTTAVKGTYSLRPKRENVVSMENMDKTVNESTTAVKGTYSLRQKRENVVSMENMDKTVNESTTAVKGTYSLRQKRENVVSMENMDKTVNESTTVVKGTYSLRPKRENVIVQKMLNARKCKDTSVNDVGTECGKKETNTPMSPRKRKTSESPSKKPTEEMTPKPSPVKRKKSVRSEHDKVDAEKVVKPKPEPVPYVDPIIQISKSVEECVQKLQNQKNGESGPSVLLYKKVGKIAPTVGSVTKGFRESDFCVVIQTPVQRQIFLNFSHIVGIDVQEGKLNDLKLVFLMVLDDFREAIPVAWMITDVVAPRVITNFFRVVRTECGDVYTHYLMAPRENFHELWCNAFGCEPMLLQNEFEVRRELRVLVNHSLTNEEARTKAWAYVESILTERKESELMKWEENMTKYFKSIPNSDKFLMNFNKTWMSTVKEWALCYRIGTPVNTIFVADSFAKLKKFVSFKGTRKLNQSIDEILKIGYDKCFLRSKRVFKGDQRLCQVQDEIQLRHKLAMLDKDAKIVPDDDHLSWSVSVHTSDSWRDYQVTDVQSCCGCKNVCTECGVCAHNYLCSCSDFGAYQIMCEHIHMVHSFRSGVPKLEVKAIDESESDTFIVISEATPPEFVTASDMSHPLRPTTGERGAESININDVLEAAGYLQEVGKGKEESLQIIAISDSDIPQKVGDNSTIVEMAASSRSKTFSFSRVRKTAPESKEDILPSTAKLDTTEEFELKKRPGRRLLAPRQHPYMRTSHIPLWEENKVSTESTANNGGIAEPGTG